jgi:hypothetical protein
VSLTLARDEVSVMVALRLFLPESWTSDPVRVKRTGVPVPGVTGSEPRQCSAAGSEKGVLPKDCVAPLSAVRLKEISLLDSRMGDYHAFSLIAVNGRGA